MDTYRYFGEPVYIYSLKEGINDGFLTPFKVKQISTTLDEYVYTADDQLIEGEIESGKRYMEPDSTSGKRPWSSAPRKTMRWPCVTSLTRSRRARTRTIASV